MVREIGAFEAKNRLGTLLDWVEQGEEVVITRRGKAVARLVPNRPGASQEDARAAAQAVREMRVGTKLLGLRIKDLIDEGARVTLVLDASLTLSWFFEDEQSAVGDEVLDMVAERGRSFRGCGGWRLPMGCSLRCGGSGSMRRITTRRWRSWHGCRLQSMVKRMLTPGLARCICRIGFN